MITFDPGTGEPQRWVVCFSRTAATTWLQRAPIGRYKHVRAFGCVVPIQTWVFFDPAMSRTSLRLARGAAATALMMEFLHEADAILIERRERARAVPRLAGWCVPQIRHLLGLSGIGALRPAALWNELLRHGGEILPHGRHTPIHAAAD